MKIIGINGVRSDGSASTDLVLKDLTNKGYEARRWKYPYTPIVCSRWEGRQYEIAESLKKKSKPGDVIVAHSYGCLLTLRAMELGAEFSYVFFFGAAIDQNVIFPYHGMMWLDNIYNKDDIALLFGKLLVAHDFGGMGKYGYDGPFDDRIRNIPAKPVENPDFWRHTNIYFSDFARKYWVNHIDKHIKELLT